jgi:hypothetical protein
MNCLIMFVMWYTHMIVIWDQASTIFSGRGITMYVQLSKEYRWVTLMVGTRASSFSLSRYEVLFYIVQRAEYLSINWIRVVLKNQTTSDNKTKTKIFDWIYRLYAPSIKFTWLFLMPPSLHLLNTVSPIRVEENRCWTQVAWWFASM